MRNSTASVLLLVAAVVFLLLAIYYIIPGPYHPFTFSGTPTDSHKTHAIVFFVVAVFAFLGSRFARSSTAR